MPSAWLAARLEALSCNSIARSTVAFGLLQALAFLGLAAGETGILCDRLGAQDDSRKAAQSQRQAFAQ